MDKETQKKLTKPFSKDEVKAPPKGKFGSYVPHHLVTKRLNDVAYGEWSHTLKEIVRDSEGRVRGAVTTFTLFGVSHDEVGDVDSVDVNNNNTEGELLKLCMSDALKRGAMRHGIGLHLWTGDVTEEEHYANKSAPVSKPKVEVEKAPVKAVSGDDATSLNKAKEEFAKDIGAKQTPIADQVNHILKEMIPNEGERNDLKRKVYNELTTSNQVDKDIESWTADMVSTFIDTVEREIDLVKRVTDVFGDVEIVKVCPTCNKADDISDMRERKANAPDGSGIKNIPDFICETHDAKYRPSANGCGWGGYIGGSGAKGVPEEWL